MTEENKMISLEALIFFYRNHALTEYLTTLSDEELLLVIRNVQANDIVGETIGIYDALLQEAEYRNDKIIYEERNSLSKSK